MTDILSQSEIDALLSALSTGEPSKPDNNTQNAVRKDKEKHQTIKVYDFKRPNKFSKDQLHTVQAIHENFARLVTTYFSARLRTSVQTTVVSVEQLTYEEVVGSIPNPTIMNVITVEPLDGSIIFEINPGIAFTIIDRLFGGPGEAPEKVRGLTDIERSVVEKVVTGLLDLLGEAWESIVEIRPKLEMIESNPQFAQIVSPAEMVVLVTFELKIGDKEGLMTLCIPYIVIEPIISKLSAHFWFSNSSRKVTQAQTAALKQRVDKVKVPMSVILGNSNITVRELLELQVGDIIQLDKASSHPMDIVVGSKPKFKGLPGVVGHKMAMQITQVILEGDDDDE